MHLTSRMIVLAVGKKRSVRPYAVFRTRREGADGRSFIGDAIGRTQMTRILMIRLHQSIPRANHRFIRWHRVEWDFCATKCSGERSVDRTKQHDARSIRPSFRTACAHSPYDHRTYRASPQSGVIGRESRGLLLFASAPGRLRTA